MSEGKTYEMLWDCKFCGTDKLLGKTHRFCPSCGAPQDPDSRYFPSDEEKVAVEDHVYTGADKICAACSTLNSASAEYCQQCGAALTQATEAKTITDDQVIRDGQQFISTGARDMAKERFDAEMQRAGVTPSTTQQKRSWTFYAVLGIIGLVVVGILLAIFWRREEVAYVSGHAWEREVNIEEYQAVSDNAWCDTMPREAYSITRREEQRGERQVADGEECTTRRVDNGDGTFREQRDCRTKYRSEPVYDTKCYFTINRWVFERAVKATGQSLAENPMWPEVRLTRTGTCLGCEREGGRGERYLVYLTEGENIYTCDLAQSQWATMQVESTWKFNVGVVTGQPDCGSLQPAS